MRRRLAEELNLLAASGLSAALLALGELSTQLRGVGVVPVDVAAGGEHTARVPRKHVLDAFDIMGLLGLEASDRVVVREGEPDGVDHFVARRAFRRARSRGDVLAQRAHTVVSVGP